MDSCPLPRVTSTALLRLTSSSVPSGCLHEGEIFTRWLQFGVFSSTFRTHCEACEIRVWMYPEEYRSQLFRTYHMRQALMPYT